MRNPNGYGSITKLKGNRRRPYMIRISNGYKYIKEIDDYVQFRPVIAYARTKAEAMEMLASYNKTPINLDYINITFSETYMMWLKEYQKENKSHSSMSAHKAAYRSVEGYLGNMKIRDIKVYHLNKALEISDKNYPALRKIKVMFNHVFKWAMKNDIIYKDYSKYIDLSLFKNKNPNAIDRHPFTDEEINTLWTNSDDPWVRYVLIYIYTGLRAGELINLKKENIDMEKHVFKVVKSKTTAGVRTVPIADKIYPFFIDLMKNDSEKLLVGMNGENISYYTFLKSYYQPLMQKLNLDHDQIHDTRHTCATLLNRANVNPTTIKKIIGHEGAMSLTEKVYTHPDYQELLDAINKI